jgi:hypothetical protein
LRGRKKVAAVKNCESEMVIFLPPCRCALLPLRFDHRSYKISKNATIYNLLRHLLDASSENMNPKTLKQLSNLCFVLGFASIIGSIAIWFLTGGTTQESMAHAERFGIFVGLWAPTFLILSNRFDRYADRITG